MATMLFFLLLLAVGGYTEFISYNTPNLETIEVVKAVRAPTACAEVNVQAHSSPVLCARTPSTINIYIETGTGPFSVYIFPDNSFGILNSAPGNISLTTTYNLPSESEQVILLDEEDNSRTLSIGLSSTNQGWVNSSIFPTHSGNFSYSMTFPGTPAGFNLLSLTPAWYISAMQFEYLEFWINIGNGGQNFTIAPTNLPGSSKVNLIYYSTDFSNNTWTQIKIHLPTLWYITRQTGQVQGLVFTDNLKTLGQNPFYIDYITLIPYTFHFPNRQLYIFDSCGTLSTLFVPVINTSFSVNITSTPISCYPSTTISTNLSTNGVLYANEIYGQRPFQYNWLFNNSTETFVSSLPQLSTFITIYDNSLNNSWRDSSIALNYSLNNTQYFLSPPSSIAFHPTLINDALIFSLPYLLNVNEYPTIEFWVYGGDIGGQTVIVNLGYPVTNAYAFTSIITSYIGYPVIPPKKWVKVSASYPPPLPLDFIYNTIEIVTTSVSVMAPAEQNTLYIDDIILIGETHILTVTDNNGCQATTRIAQVLSPPPITQDVTVTNALCYNSTNGKISVSMAGGVPPYFFTWSTLVEDTNSILLDLDESIININVTDSNGCQFKMFTATVLQPPVLETNFTVVEPLCYGGYGQIIGFTTGGIGLYTYTWYSSTSNPTIIPQPSPDTIFQDTLISGFTMNNINTICYGTGSHLDYTFSPSHSGYCSLLVQFTENISTAKIYGCSTCLNPQKYSSIMFWIYSNNSIILNNLHIALLQQTIQSNEILLSSLTSLSANTWNQVVLNLSLINLTNPDGFIFINTATEQMGNIIIDDIVIFPIIATGLGYSVFSGFQSIIQGISGIYFMLTTDLNGCALSTQITMSQPTEIQISYNSISPSSDNENNGAIIVAVTGGIPPYSYYWGEINTTIANISNLASGVYTLTVTDSNGCTKTLTALVDPYIKHSSINKYNASLSGGLGAIVSVGLLICLFSMLMLLRYWNSFSLLGSFLSSMILIGCISSFGSAVVLLPKPSDKLCTAFPWLLGIGFVLVYGCLFIKTWALYQVWRKAIHYQKGSLTPTYIMKCLGLALLIEIIFLIIWTLIDPPKVHLIKVVNNNFEYQCDTNHITFWVIFLVGKGLWLIFGAVLSILTRNVVKEYNESTSIAYAIYNNILLGTIAIPLAILIKEVPGARLVVEVVIITLAFSFTMVVIFYRIWHSIMLPDKIHLQKMESSTSQKQNSSGSIRSRGASSTTKASGSGSGSASGTDTSH